MPAQIYQFESFQLDMRERQLACNGRVIPLRAKVFDTLCVLIQHAGRLVRKDELMQTIWPDSVVEENNLEHNLSVLRKVFKQNHTTGQKFIETVPRQGYRFVAKVDVLENAGSAPLAVQAAQHPLFVTERDSQLQCLQHALKKAQLGERQTVFLTGEAGIGKTTLVYKFLADLQETSPLRITTGECLDQRGPGEAYMPVLEAFARLCRQSDGKAVVEILKRRAPTWLFQLPSAVSSEERLSLQQSPVGLTQERMLREGVDALEAIAADQLLILVLEDLHWSDSSTLDLILRLARGQEPSRLLVIGTYRPAEAKTRSRSVFHLVQQLRLRECCQELPLGFLSEQGIASYLHNRLRGSVPRTLSPLLHQRTEGNPLFATVLVNFWMANGSLREESGHWILSADVDSAALEAPDTLRQVIEEQVEQLRSDEQEIVGAASAAGVEFCASLVAAALNRSSADVEMQCATLAQRGQFFTTSGQSDWPDGTVCQRYRFIHNLYREVTYRRLPAGLRVRWHRQIGERMEQAFAGQEDRMATELAEHFQRAHDARRAIHYLKKRETLDSREARLELEALQGTSELAS